MTFSATLEAMRPAGNGTVHLGEDWTQGRPVFGGLVGAAAVMPMLDSVSSGRELRSVSFSFVAPVAPGDATVTTRALREGRSVSQFQSELLQDGTVQCVALATFGVGRASSAVMEAETAPDAESPDRLTSIPYQEGVSPRFTRFFEYRFCIGNLPYTGATTRDLGGWIRFRDEAGPVGPLQLLGLIDAWPPATLPLLTERAPSSSLTWFVEFVHPLPAIKANDWLLYQATLDHAQDGYGQTQARLWTSAGQLVAISRQTVAVFG